MTAEAERLRRAMVSTQIRDRGVRHERVLEALGEVERHRFVEASLKDAYADHPLPIGYGQTLSQPYMVARMTELLAPEPHHRILEVGAGSGYQTAVLARLCAHVFAVERLEVLASRAKRALDELGVRNVSLITRDGTIGWPQEAPFDGILVAAGAPAVPRPYLEQLTEGGRLVIPVGKRHVQELQCVTVDSRGEQVVRDVACRFVKLIGEHGWPEDP